MGEVKLKATWVITCPNENGDTVWSEMSLQSWSPAGSLALGGSGHIEGGTWLEKVDHGVQLLGGSPPWTLPVSLCFLASLKGAALPHTPTTIILCLTSGPQQWTQLTVGWNLWNCKPKSVFPLLNCSRICHSQSVWDKWPSSKRSKRRLEGLQRKETVLLVVYRK
jgi:hypothetical protein